MLSEYITIIACCLVIIFVIGLFIYRKKTGNENDQVTLLISLGAEIFISYVEKRASKDAKDFDEISDYIIFVKNFIREQLLLRIKQDDQISESVKIILTDTFLDDVVDDLIEHNAASLQVTFESVKGIEN